MSISKNVKDAGRPSGGPAFSITTKRLVLRAPRPNDLDAMFAVYRDPRAMRYWSTTPHASKEVTAALLKRRIAAWHKAQVNFQVTLDGAYIGNAGNYDRDEVGFMLSPAHWRKGYMLEAMQAIIPHIWHVTQHARLLADADPLNTASVGLLKALGFQETHRAKNTFCIDGVWSDSVYLSLPRPLIDQ